MVTRRESLGLVTAGLASGLWAARSPRAIAGAGQPIEILSPDALTQGGWLRGRTSGRSLTLDGAPVGIAPDGMFFVAFDRNAGPSALLRADLADGSHFDLPLAITPRKWQIQRLDIPKIPGKMPSAEFLALRKGELAQIKAARAEDTGSQGWREKFIWPVTGRISSPFGSQRIYQGVPGSYHSGVDIATGRSGTPIVAPADGTVILAAEKPFTLEGHLLMLDHGMGLNSALLHCSELDVKLGDRVKQGQFIARVGMTGRATGPHLHWSLKWKAARLDPLLFTGPMPAA